MTNHILLAAGVRRRPAKVHKAHPTGCYDVASLNPTGKGEIQSAEMLRRNHYIVEKILK